MPGSSHWVERRYWPFVVVALALGSWLRAPALHATMASDDWDHYAMATGMFPVQRAPWDYYTFIANDPVERQVLRDSGRLPWWSDPDIYIAFLRPIASLSLWVDHHVLGSDQLLAHVHSAAWWWLGALAVAAVLRQLLPATVALGAVALYALDDAHALPLAWSANRGELIAVALMVWALWARLEQQRRGLTRHRWLAVALVCAAMLCGEHALPMLGFLIACVLAEQGSPWRARSLELAALLAPALVYLVVRAAMGYGASSSGFYVDPFSEPLRFLEALKIHAPLLSGDLLFGYAADYWYGEPPWRDPLLRLGLVPAGWLDAGPLHDFQLGCGVLALGVVLIALFALGRPGVPETARPLRWLLAGAVLALVPLAATLPMTRLTMGPSLAFHALFAWLASQACQALGELRGAARPGRRVGTVLVLALLLGAHGVQAAARGRELAEHYRADSRAQARWVARAKLGGAQLTERHVFMLGSGDLASSYSLPFVRSFTGTSVPKTSELLLPPHSGPLVVERVSANILDVSARTKDGFREFRTSAYRREDRDFETGDILPGSRFSVVVIAAKRGLPTRLRFVFPRPLEAADYLFVYPTKAGIAPLALPPIGRVGRLSAPTWPKP
jgi:hypothetical protein